MLVLITLGKALASAAAGTATATATAAVLPSCSSSYQFVCAQEIVCVGSAHASLPLSPPIVVDLIRVCQAGIPVEPQHQPQHTHTHTVRGIAHLAKSVWH